AAERAEVSEKGAMPPATWQLVHLAAKIGATSFQVAAGAAPAAPPPSPRVAIVPAATAASSAATANAALRLTCGAYRAYPACVLAEVTVEIARSPEDVFAYLADVSNLPSWQSGVHSAALEGEPRA